MKWVPTVIYSPTPEPLLDVVGSRVERRIFTHKGSWAIYSQDSRGLIRHLGGATGEPFMLFARQVSDDGTLADLPRTLGGKGKKNLGASRIGSIFELTGKLANLATPGVIKAEDWDSLTALVCRPEALKTAAKAGLGNLIPLIRHGDLIDLPDGCEAGLVATMTVGADVKVPARFGDVLERLNIERPEVCVVKESSMVAQTSPWAGGRGVDRNDLLDPPDEKDFIKGDRLRLVVTRIDDLTAESFIERLSIPSETAEHYLTLVPTVEEHLATTVCTPKPDPEVPAQELPPMGTDMVRRADEVKEPEPADHSACETEQSQLRKRIESLELSLERARQDLKKERAHTQQLTHKVNKLTQPEPEPETAPDEDSKDAPPASSLPEGIVRPVPVPSWMSGCRSFADATQWAVENLGWVHVEDTAFHVDELLHDSRRLPRWVNAYATTLTVLDGWARSLQAGWNGNTVVYADLVGVLGAKAFSMGETNLTMEHPALRGHRVRQCCKAMDDGDGTHLFTPHARLTASKNPAPRLYFDMGRDGRVHVAYVGPHLPTVTTISNRLGH